MQKIKSKFRLFSTLVMLALIGTMFVLYAWHWYFDLPKTAEEVTRGYVNWFGMLYTLAFGLVVVSLRWEVLAAFVNSFRRPRLHLVSGR